MHQHRSLSTAVMLSLLLAGSITQPAGATLIFDSVQDLTGTGLGAVNTVLTVQSPANTTTEQGCVGRSTAGCPGGTLNSTPSDPGRIIGGTLGGHELTGDAQTKTIAASILGITEASELRIVFNASEPGNVLDQGITLNDLRLTIYNADNSVQFTSGPLPAAIPFPDATGGVGQAGFVFRLDEAQSAAAGLIEATDRIGLSALISNAEGAPETFFLTSARVPGGPVAPPIPEPSTLLLLGSGLLSLGLARRRKITN